MSWELAITAVQSNVMEIGKARPGNPSGAPFPSCRDCSGLQRARVGPMVRVLRRRSELERCVAFANRASMVHEARRSRAGLAETIT